VLRRCLVLGLVVLISQELKLLSLIITVDALVFLLSLVGQNIGDLHKEWLLVRLYNSMFFILFGSYVRKFVDVGWVSLGVAFKYRFYKYLGTLKRKKEKKKGLFLVLALMLIGMRIRMIDVMSVTVVDGP